jgi:hypothetical protein
MKKTALISIVVISFAISAFVLPGSIITDLGCDEQSAKYQIVNDFSYSQLYLPACDPHLRTIDKKNRPGYVSKVGDFIKAYVQTEEFKTQYLENHEYFKPVEPALDAGQSPDQQMQEAVKQIEEQLNNPNLPEEQKEALRQSLEAMKQLNSDPAMNQMMNEGYAQEQKAKKEQYEKDLAQYKTDIVEWEKMRDVNYMLKKRLQDFLDLTASIDFNAKLREDNGRFYFVNSDYETKSNAWKMCFRAGKPFIDAARAYASAWMKELGK